MTGRKTAADTEGWRKGQGAYSKEVPLKRGSFPNSVTGVDPRGAGAYTNDSSGLNRVNSDDVKDVKFVDPERLTNDATIDIWDVVESNQPDDGNQGLKPRGGQS